MILAELLRIGVSELEQAGIEESALDAMLLLQHCTGKNRAEIFLAGRTEITSQLEKEYLDLLCRRTNREPVAYIVGEREFWSLPFFVNRDVLIPRPETEFLLDRVLTLTDPVNFVRGKILDLCCGSGVIAVVLAYEKGRPVVAADISVEALSVARKNAIAHNLDRLVLPVQASLLSCFNENHAFSLVVSNPPYVSSEEVKGGLAPEVLKYEPHLALDGGIRGLEIIEKIRHTLPAVLTRGGQCFLEIGADQGNEVYELFTRKSEGRKDFQHVEILKDYAGRDRVVHARAAE